MSEGEATPERRGGGVKRGVTMCASPCVHHHVCIKLITAMLLPSVSDPANSARGLSSRVMRFGDRSTQKIVNRASLTPHKRSRLLLAKDVLP